MSDVPNIKRELLEYVRETTEPNDTIDKNKNTVCNLREFASESGYGERRIAKKVYEINAAHDDGTVFDWGVSPMHVWYYDRADIDGSLARVTPGEQVATQEDGNADTDIDQGP